MSPKNVPSLPACSRWLASRLSASLHDVFVATTFPFGLFGGAKALSLWRDFFSQYCSGLAVHCDSQEYF